MMKHYKTVDSLQHGGNKVDVMSQPLLKGSIILVHEQNDKVVPLRRDILVRENRVHQLAQDIKSQDGFEGGQGDC